MIKKIIVAIDFDGTIVEQKFPKIGKMRKNAKKYINKLYEDGYYIIIWTCRGEYSLIKAIKWLEKNKSKYHKINENADFDIIGFKPSPKIFYHFLVDDLDYKGIDEWDVIYKTIKKRTEEKKVLLF